MATLVILELKLKAEAIGALKQTLKAILPETRAYAGCKDVHFYENQDDPTSFMAVETWESRDAYQRYLAWRTEAGVMAKLGELLAGPPSFRYFDAVDA